MLRKITSETWNETDESDADKAQEEIFIERDGATFQFILHYMRDGKVILPLSIPRAQLVSELCSFSSFFLFCSTITITITEAANVDFVKIS